MSQPRCRYLLVPDTHAPYCDWQKVRELGKWAKSAKPERIILLGDLIDAYALSRFSKSNLEALSAKSIRREREAAQRIIELFVGLSKEPVDYLFGNHEARLQSRLGENPFLAFYLGRPLQELERRHLRIQRSGELVLPSHGGGLYVCHGFRAQRIAGSAAASLVNGRSCAQGHSHGLGLIWCAGGRYGLEAGYLARPDAECFAYAPGLKHGMRNWRHGFAWIDSEGVPHLEAL